MKTAILFTAFLFSNFSFAESVLSKCHDAAYATGYVYENRFLVSIDTSSKDFNKMIQDRFWDLMKKGEIEVLKSPPLAIGQDFEEKKNYIFHIKTDFNAGGVSSWNRVDSILSTLNDMEAVRVTCLYITQWP